ncbi:MAG: dihydroneopterin aldolase [Gammaproteobacteria bacterium]
MDIIHIRQLQLTLTLGIHAWEQKIKRKVFFDLDLGTDIAAGAQSDDIGNTLNYEVLNQRLQQHLTENTFQLIETLAQNVADFILKEFPVPWLRLTVTKPHPIKNVASTAVTIERKL